MKNRSVRTTVWLLLGSLLLATSCARPRFAWELPVPPVRETPIVAEGALIRRTLANGLRVLLLEDHSRPMVSVGLTVRRGKAIEEPGKEGVAVLCGEVMQRGAGERDAFEIARTVDEMGAALSVGVGWDSIRVGASGLARDADALLQIVSDVAQRPHLAQNETEKARSEQLADLAGALDNPRTLLGWQLARTLYPEHRYGIPSAGFPETVRQLIAEDVRTFHERVFHPGNAVFHATGDFDARSLLEQIEQAFGQWVPQPIPAPVVAPTATTPPARTIVVVDRPEMVQVQIAVAHEGLARRDPRRIPASLLNGVLGGSGFSSRLTVRIRSEAGLTYGIRSGFAMHRRPGRFAVTTFTRADQVRPALELLLEEVRAIRNDRPVSADELRTTKAFSVGQFALGLETSAAVMGSLVNLDVHGLPEDSLDTYRRRVQQVTQAEIAGLARELLHPERAAIVLVGPADLLLPELESFGSVEVVSW